jgi:hypothetical protein
VVPARDVGRCHLATGARRPIGTRAKVKSI